MKMKNLKLKNKTHQQGQAFIVIIIFALFISLAMAFSSIIPAIGEFQDSSNLILSKKSYFLAESGLEDAIYRIKTAKPISTEEKINLDGQETTINITETDNGKDITSSSNFLDIIRKVRIELTTTIGVEFFYGVQVGEGGLEMGENSHIEGTEGARGSVYSNGSITGENGAIITGDATVAAGFFEDGQAKSIVCNQDQIIGRYDPEIDFAQSFKPSESKPLSKIALYIKKVGNPGDREIKITADASGSPSVHYITKAILSFRLVGTNYGWIDVVFSSPPTLIQGNTYWIVLDADKDKDKYWLWCKDSNQGYENGIAQYSKDWDSGPWTQIVGDLNFKIYLGVGTSSINNIAVLGNVRANSIIKSEICGNAYYKTIDADSLNFVNYPSAPPCLLPLSSGTAFSDQPDPPIENMPISDANIEDWEKDAKSGGIINGNCGTNGVAECSIADKGILILGPKKINGNLVLTKKQTLIVSGSLYFTGYIDINSSSGATIKCDPSFGSKSCVIITDSWIHSDNNVTFQGSGTEGSYIMLLTTLAGCNGGLQSPECTHYNGAIDIHNNTLGAIFYSPDSMIHLHNGVHATEITAYKLQLENNAIITYENGLINSQFSSGPSGGWKINNWQEIE